MFGFIADILTSVTSILFPIFASYKAIRTGDPALLTPWLMYWTTLSLFLAVESQLYFILSWVPFYAWMRLGVHLYLVAPGKQGSVMIYQEYIHPFLEEHERQIDQTISSTHAKAKAAGLDVFKRAYEYVRTQFLGQPPRQPTPPVSRNVSYSAALLNRFNMPAARSSFVSAAAAAGGAGSTSSGDLFNILGKAMQQYSAPTSGSRDMQAEDLTRSGSLIPPTLSGAERTDFVNTQRDRLRTLLQAFDQEANPDDHTATATGRSAYPQQPSGRKSYLAPSQMDGSGYMHKSRSESEFEDLAYEPMPDPDSFRAPPSAPGTPHEGGNEGASRPKRESAGWSNFIWGNYGERDSAEGRRKDL